MSQPRFTITNNDPTSGKRLKYTSMEVRFQNGDPIEFIGKITFHETSDDSDVAPAGTITARRAVESFVENYSVEGKIINSTTKVYQASLTDSEGAPIAGNVRLRDYFADKLINTFPNTAGGDALWKGIEGVCKEMIAVRKANGEFPA